MKQPDLRNIAHRGSVDPHFRQYRHEV